jgi:formate dehydrogenase formation protein
VSDDEPPDAAQPWTLERVAAERPDLAPMAHLHAVLAETSRRVAEGLGVAQFHPQFPGTPAAHWVLGKSLFEGCDRRTLLAPTITLFGAMLKSLADVFPPVAQAAVELRAAVSRDDFPWDARIERFRTPLRPDEMPHAALFRFLLFRALAVPLAHLARAHSPPHPDRWLQLSCPYCGVPPAAQIAQTGGARKLLCVLCGGTWETRDLACVSCGEEDRGKALVLASREAGPASFEACSTCRLALKVFAPGELVPGPPVALEILTVGLDLLARDQEGIERNETALAALFPPP